MRRRLHIALTMGAFLCSLHAASGAGPARAGERAFSAAVSAPPLGRRRFSLSEDSYSAIRGLPVAVRSSSVAGHLVFDAGAPDPTTGQAAVDLVDASDFIAIALPSVQRAICLRPLKEQFPIRNAGSLACTGGIDAGLRITQDHRIGTVDTCRGGSREEQPCAATPDCADAGDCNADGVIGVDELLRQAKTVLGLEPVSGCSPADRNSDGILSIDELVLAVSNAFRGPTTCFAAENCAALGGALDVVPRHAGICNGPIESTPGGGDSGAGSLVISLPFDVVSEMALPCGDEPEATGQQASILLTTGISTATIRHVNDSDKVLSEELTGENFSCPDWTREDGPGTLLLAAPVIDAPSGMSDLYFDIINVFSFDD